MIQWKTLTAEKMGDSNDNQCQRSVTSKLINQRMTQQYTRNSPNNLLIKKNRTKILLVAYKKDVLIKKNTRKSVIWKKI